MKIEKKRIRNIEPYLIGIKSGSKFYVSMSNMKIQGKIYKSGFGKILNVGDQVTPSVIGKISNFNANGGYIKHKDRPKETLYREGVVTDWHGNTHVVDIPYKRFPRTPIKAPCVNLTIHKNHNSEFVICSQLYEKGKTSKSLLLHTINLFLELFGECEIFTSDMMPVLKTRVKNLNWRILPKGNYPWKNLKGNISSIIQKYNKKSFQKLIESRLEVISNYNPDFVAIGEAGFNGYVVFGFPQNDFYILESVNRGNATYVFGDNWEALSKMSKDQIINQSLQKLRLIHSHDWRKGIEKLFK